MPETNDTHQLNFEMLNASKISEETTEENEFKLQGNDDNNSIKKFFEKSLLDFISDKIISVRLHNALVNASNRSKLPFKNIKEYLDAGQDAIALIGKLEHVGRKTVNELNNLILDEYTSLGSPILNVNEENAFQNIELSDFSNVKLETIITSKSVNTRLRNAIENRLIPFETVEEYLKAGGDAINQLRKIKNLGNKSVYELVEIIESFIKEYYDDENKSLEIPESYEEYFKNINLYNFIQSSYISLTIKKKIEVVKHNELSKLSLYFYYENYGYYRKQLINYADLEQIEISELDKIIVNYYENILDLNCTKYLVDENVLLDKIREILKPREFGIFIKRTGLLGQNKHTLEELASSYLLTRERIRQIQKKTIKKLKHSEWVFDATLFIKYKHKEIEKLIFHGSGFVNKELAWANFRKLDKICSLAIELCFENILGWLDTYYIKSNSYWALPGTNFDNAIGLELSAFSSRWKIEIKHKAESMTWPINLLEISEAFPQFSYTEIENFFRDELNATIENGFVIRQEKLRIKTKIIYIFRDSRRALHTSEVRARHKEMFHSDIGESQISNTLQSMEEALIVNRGMYNLYENLVLTNDDINEIRHKSHAFLKSKNEYISSKVIYKKLYRNQSHRFGADFSSYMLFGILQDDDRFSVKRGFMVATSDSDIVSQFQSLTDEIISIVKQYGPINVPGIKQHLAEKRSLLDVTVSMLLNSSDQIVQTEIAGYFYTVDKVIGDEIFISKLDDILEICLLDGGKSLHFIHARLEENEIYLSKRTIKSWLRKKSTISHEKGIYTLDEPSQDAIQYLEILNKFKDDGFNGKQLFNKLSLELSNSSLSRYILIDFRLSEKIDEIEEEKDVLESILEEFRFI